MAVSAVEAGLAQTGPVKLVTSALVGTVAFLLTVLPIITFWTTVLAELPTHTLRTAASSGDRVAGPSVFTLTGQAAVLAIGAFWASLIAYESSPSSSTRTAILLCVTRSSVLTVITCRNAVWTK